MINTLFEESRYEPSQPSSRAYNRVVNGTKTCGKCCVNKPIDKFHHYLAPTGDKKVVYSYCKACHAGMQRARRKTDERLRNKIKARAGASPIVVGNDKAFIERWERRKENARNYYRRIRLDTLRHYSPSMSCACCGELTVEFLTLDHKYGDGAKHRRDIKKQRGVNNNTFAWAKNQGYPPIFQVLCMNCNMAKGMYGECPHKANQQSAVLR